MLARAIILLLALAAINLGAEASSSPAVEGSNHRITQNIVELSSNDADLQSDFSELHGTEKTIPSSAPARKARTETRRSHIFTWIFNLLTNVAEWWEDNDDTGTYTVFDVVALSPEHGTLQTLVDSAGLNSALQVVDATYTVFAPTNDAFDSLAAEQNIIFEKLSSGNPSWTPLLREVLLFHILPQEISSDDFSDAQTPYATLQGNSSLLISDLEPHITGQQTAQGTADINYPDMHTENGIVHSIDGVLLPPSATRTVLDVAVNSDDFSTLETLVGLANLTGALGDEEAALTVFAPTNEAFAKLPKQTLDFLLKPENKAKLVDILTYHVASGSVHAADLKNGEKIKTVEGKQVEARIFGNGKYVYINNARVTTADVDASNGVVHIIDSVLIPPAMQAQIKIQSE